VVFDSWKSLRQSLCPKYAEYKRWSIQVHVSSRKFQFDPVGKPGQKAVIFFTGEGKMPHFEVLEDANNKRTVDYVDGFDEVRVVRTSLIGGELPYRCFKAMQG
jgi:hypothetical protein